VQGSSGRHRQIGLVSFVQHYRAWRTHAIRGLHWNAFIMAARTDGLYTQNKKRPVRVAFSLCAVWARRHVSMASTSHLCALPRPLAGSPRCLPWSPLN
jgi:hypothetical protein